MSSSKIFWAAALSGIFLLSGCETTSGPRVSAADAKLRKEALVDHAIYRSLGAWKKSTYRNKELIAQATPQNASVEISIAEQRGVLLVRGAVAMDFPVATGKPSHPTPPGVYHIMAKEKDYHSNLYGRIFDAGDKVLVMDADTRVDKVPEGGKFVAASMPYWMRLTDTGVGMHVGYVPGVAASHGCIRLKDDVAKQLFDIVGVGTQVTVTQGPPAALQSQ